MRLLNLRLHPQPTPIGRNGNIHILGTFDLQLDRGVTARCLTLVRDPENGKRLIWSKRYCGQPTVEIDDEGRVTVLSLIDQAEALGHYRAA